MRVYLLNNIEKIKEYDDSHKTFMNTKNEIADNLDKDVKRIGFSDMEVCVVDKVNYKLIKSRKPC